MAGNPIAIVWSLRFNLMNEAATTTVTWYLGFHAIVAVLGFALAALRLRASAEPRPSGAPLGRARRFVALVLGRRTAARRHPPVSDRPVFWREIYVDPGSRGGFLRRLLILGLLAAVVLPFHSYQHLV